MKRSSSGFMLMEVLVSILIFSVGVLALIGLQAKLTKAQSASKLRTDASYLAQEAIAQMWADMAHAPQYASGCASYSPCNDWALKVAAELPNGSGSISYNSAADVYTISIVWQVSGEGHSFSTTTTLKTADATI